MEIFDSLKKLLNIDKIDKDNAMEITEGLPKVIITDKRISNSLSNWRKGNINFTPAIDSDVNILAGMLLKEIGMPVDDEYKLYLEDDDARKTITSFKCKGKNADTEIKLYLSYVRKLIVNFNNHEYLYTYYSNKENPIGNIVKSSAMAANSESGEVITFSNGVYLLKGADRDVRFFFSGEYNDEVSHSEVDDLVLDTFLETGSLKSLDEYFALLSDALKGKVKVTAFFLQIFDKESGKNIETIRIANNRLQELKMIRDNKIITMHGKEWSYAVVGYAEKAIDLFEDGEISSLGSEDQSLNQYFQNFSGEVQDGLKLTLDRLKKNRTEDN